MMQEPSSALQVSSEERLWAALAHLTVFLLGWGLIGPVLIWITQRQKSAYAAFHALQALAYQLLFAVYSVVVSFGLAGLIAVFTAGFVMASPNLENSAESPLFILFLQFLMFMILLSAYGLYLLIGLAGAGLSLAGKDFCYPLLGMWIKRYISDDSPSSGNALQTKEIG